MNRKKNSDDDDDEEDAEEAEDKGEKIKNYLMVHLVVLCVCVVVCLKSASSAFLLFYISVRCFCCSSPSSSSFLISNFLLTFCFCYCFWCIHIRESILFLFRLCLFSYIRIRLAEDKTVRRWMKTTSRLLSIAVVSSTAAKFDRFRSNDFWFDRGLDWDGMPCRCWLWLYVKPTPRFIGYFI